MYNISELDFGKTGHCENFLKKPENRKNFVDQGKNITMDKIMELLPNFNPDDEYGDPGEVAIGPDGKIVIAYDGDITLLDRSRPEGDFVFIPRYLIPELLDAIINLTNERVSF